MRFSKKLKNNFIKIKNKFKKIGKQEISWRIFVLFILGVLVGYGTAIVFLQYPKILELEIKNIEEEKSKIEQYFSEIPYEQAIINASKNVSPSVVSIIVSKMVPIYEQQFIDPFDGNNAGPLSEFFDFKIPQYVEKESKLQEVGQGSGFIVSADGMVVTNKHVVLDQKAEYTVFTNDGKKYPANVLALDPVQDLAIIKISASNGEIFQPVVLGNSDNIQIGQTAIAIGNALGEFRNTVSVGVISGLGRTISASNQGQNFSEILEDIIQTDAAINPGNSGGPLLNLKGEVVGINVAIAQGADSIGFALPINFAKRAIDQVAKTNKIVYPFLGVRYILVDEKVKEKYDLSVDHGALVLKGDKGEPAVTKDSGAEKAGIKENDVILSIDGEKIEHGNSLSKIIQKYNAGDKINLHILRPASSAGGNGEEIDIEAVLGERTS